MTGVSRPRDLTLYWWGQTTTAFGSVFTAIALPVVAVAYLNATPGQVGVISAASIVPALLLGMPAGVLADRIARPRRTLILLDAVSALAVGVVALGLVQHAVSVLWLVALSLIQGAVAIFAEIVYFIHLRELTGLAGIGRARARLQAGQFSAGFVGRLLAGPTIVIAGPAAALAVDGVSFVLSAAALLSMYPAAVVIRAPATAGALRNLGAGLRFFVSDAFHRALLMLIVAPIAAGAGVTALTAPFLLRVVHVPTGAYGAIFAASGLLGLAGSALAGRVLGPGRDPRQVTVLAFTASLAATLLLPLSAGPLPAAAACAALGVGLPIFFGSIANVALSPVLVADVAEDAVGRTVALLQVFAAAAALLGALAGGALGDAIGVRNAMWVMLLGGLTAVGLALPRAIRSTVPVAVSA